MDSPKAGEKKQQEVREKVEASVKKTGCHTASRPSLLAKQIALFYDKKVKTQIFFYQEAL
jgi:hypothetical protein